MPKYLSKNIEMIQKSALRTILSGTPYIEALAKLEYDARRTFFTQKTVRNIASGGCLSRHLP